MISSNKTLWGSRKTIRRLDFNGEPGPVAVQIVGSEPAAMARAARMNADNGAQIIDINMGCPAKKVCKADAGSALLRNESLVADIIGAVVAAVDIPVTLKIRTGWDKQSRNGTRIARIAKQEGSAPWRSTAGHAPADSPVARNTRRFVISNSPSTCP